MENEYREYVTFNITASDGFDVEKIGREFEYKRIAEDYMAMED